MITVKRLTKEDVACLPVISDSAFVSENVTLKVSRSALSLTYLPLPSSFFLAIPPLISPEQAFDNGGTVLGAYEDGVYIGCCSLIPEAAGWLNVADIRVNAANRRHGAASLLLSTAFAISREKCLNGLHIIAADSNPVLCQCCQHMEFSIGGFDKYSLAFTSEEKAKPLPMRTCCLHFYKWNE